MRIHEGLPVLHDGVSLAEADAVMILLHGRGGSGEDMIGLGQEVSAGWGRIAMLAPQAAGGTWSPQRFLAPLAQNEPYLTSALGVVAQMIDELVAREIRRERIVLIGFSQGACLALEFAARHPHRYGGGAGLGGPVVWTPRREPPGGGGLLRKPRRFRWRECFF